MTSTMIHTAKNPCKSASSVFYILFALALLLSACRTPEEPPIFASFAPTSPMYARLEIELNRSDQAGETGAGDITLTFISNGGLVIPFALTARGGELYLAQDLPGMGLQEGNVVSAEVLRTILIDSGVVSAGQFKITEAERTRKLVLQMTDPAQFEKMDLQGFQLLETNLAADE